MALIGKMDLLVAMRRRVPVPEEFMLKEIDVSKAITCYDYEN